MIDLHTHSTASDGTHTPAELVDLARASGLDALAITDHDTLTGYDSVAASGGANGLDLVCAIELSGRNQGRPRSVHLLGYFLDAPPDAGFRGWLDQVQSARKDRNERLARRLRGLGVEIELEEVEEVGRSIAGRPHFARLLVEKGYVGSRQEAFSRYLAEGGSAHVPREGPDLPTCIERVRAAGGLAVAAHPIRWGLNVDEEPDALAGLVSLGLQGLEAWHSDQSAEDAARYQALAGNLGLAVSGGSDFHGDIKPRIRIGVGPGHLNIPNHVLETLRTLNAF